MKSPGGMKSPNSEYILQTHLPLKSIYSICFSLCIICLPEGHRVLFHLSSFSKKVMASRKSLLSYHCQAQLLARNSLGEARYEPKCRDRIQRAGGEPWSITLCAVAFCKAHSHSHHRCPGTSTMSSVFKTLSNLSRNWFMARAKYVPLSDTNGVNLDTYYYNNFDFEGLFITINFVLRVPTSNGLL